jgi:hypothetical protein
MVHQSFRRISPAKADRHYLIMASESQLFVVSREAGRAVVSIDPVPDPVHVPETPESGSGS